MKLDKNEILGTLEYWKKMFCSTGNPRDWTKKDNQVYKYLYRLIEKEKEQK